MTAVLKLCECGCGKPAPLAKRTWARLGWRKGQPLRYIHGHNGGSSNLYDSLEDCFWKNCKRGDVKDCWQWRGHLEKAGYGVVEFRGKAYKAHRLSYEIHYGSFLSDLRVCHRCDNRSCVNPAHLFLGTNADNNKDRDEKGRQSKGDRHGSAKLTEKDVSRIRNLIAQGMTQLEVASQYGVSKTAIRDLVNRKTWKHVS